MRISARIVLLWFLSVALGLALPTAHLAQERAQLETTTQAGQQTSNTPTINTVLEKTSASPSVPRYASRDERGCIYRRACDKRSDGTEDCINKRACETPADEGGCINQRSCDKRSVANRCINKRSCD